MSGEPRGIPRVVRAANPSLMTLDGTRTFLVGTDRPLVIDPGPADETHMEGVEAALEGRSPLAIVLTHAHADHSGLAPRLAERTGAPVWMGRGALREPLRDGNVGRWLGNGDPIETDAGPLTVVATPGHAPEHLALLWTPPDGPRTLFAGDLFLGQGDTTVVSHPEGSVRDYLRSLEVVEALGAELIYPAHGPESRDPEGMIRRYRRHRLQRVEEVRALLREHPGAPVEALVSRIYGAELDPTLLPAARGSVRAVMDYLEAGAAG